MWWAIAGAIAGAVAGHASYVSKQRRQQAEIARQRELAEKAYGYESAYKQGMFSLQRGQALDELGIARGRLAQAFGADVEGFNLGLEGQALQNQDARIALADNAGMALAAQGASGTRGSDSLQMKLDYAHNSFNRQMDLQERGNSLAMQNMARQYTNEFGDIGREIDSWSPGGYRYRANELGKTYDAQMHELKMADYNAAYQDAGFNWLDFLTAGVGGAGSGAASGVQVDKWWEQVGKK
jgi:hypothetical protein